jgi:outer membrane protein assembly factor BamB
MKHTLVTGCLFLMLSLNGLAQTLNWPQFRGPQGLGISEQKGLPTEWGPDDNLAWKTPLPGRGHSSPVVWGDRVFLTTTVEGEEIPGAKAVHHVRNKQTWVHPDATAGNKKQTLKVLCLDRKTGKILWERTSFEGQVYDDRHRKNTYSSGTPVTDGKYVYAFFEAEGLYC